MVNYTRAGKNELENVSFSPKTEVNPEDEGAVFDIVIGNPGRNRLEIPPAWFNFDYWTSDGLPITYKGSNPQ